MLSVVFFKLFPMIVCWRAKHYNYNGVELRIGDFCLLASERSERDTYRGNTIENRGCLLASERDSIRGG